MRHPLFVLALMLGVLCFARAHEVRANEPAPAAAAASAATTSASAPAPAVVRVHERAAFTLKAARAGQSPADRARAASRALETVVEEGEPPESRVEEQDGAAVIFIGKTPIVTLGEEDAAAEGESLHVYASSVAARVQEGVRAEQTRSTIASTVFSVSLLVFSGLIAFLLFRRVGEFADRARAWVKANPERIPALRLRHIEVIRPKAVRGAVQIALGLGHLLAQISIGYAWLLIALSLFNATRGYTERLTGFVLTPFWALLGRLGSALPVVVVASIAAVAVGVLVRFVALFFESVALGDTKLSWLPSELAAPTSVLARAGIIVVSLVLSAPLLTGTDDGALSRVGVAVLVAIGLSATPVIASVAAGIPVVFGRRLVAGEFVEIGTHTGRVKELSLLTITLEGSDGSELRIPHLLGLVRATRVIGSAPAVSFEITVDAGEAQARVRELLLTALAPRTARATVELITLDSGGARYRITAFIAHGGGDLPSALADTLRAENIALGAARGGS
jgi:small-conductance mechanosensitive channel